MTNLLILMNAYLTKFYDEVQSWAYTNSIVVTAGGWTIGTSTYHFIVGLIAVFKPLQDLIISIFVNLSKVLGLKNTGLLYGIISSIVNVVVLFAGWILTIIITFLLLEYILNNKIFGLKTNIKENEKKDFIKAKVLAQNDELQGKDLIEKEKIILEKNKKEVEIATNIIEKELNMINDNDKDDNYEKFISKIL